MYGEGRIYRRRRRWWIAYHVEGEEFREGGWRKRKEARDALGDRLADARAGRFTAPDARRRTVGELAEALVTNLETRGRPSLASYRSHLKPIKAQLGHLRASHLSTEQIEAFIRAQLAEGYRPASVNRSTGALRQALRLAYKRRTLLFVPHVPMLEENNARQGFCEPEEFSRIYRALPHPVDSIAKFAYITGWRKSEILGIRWSWVDRRGRELRIPRSKNGEGRVIPVAGELWPLIERLWGVRSFIDPLEGKTASEYVFHRKGRPLVDFRKAWLRACTKAKAHGRLFHDLCRTAIRDMRRAGTDRSIIKKISGRKTDSIIDRYNIVGPEEMAPAIERTGRYRVRIVSGSRTHSAKKRRVVKRA